MSSAEPSSPSEAERGSDSQLAIQVFGADDSARIEAHFLRLAPEDRSLRFAAGLVTDGSILDYVARFRYEDDVVVGIADCMGQVVALGHGCVYDSHGRRQTESAFSVDAPWRGQGLGTRLMSAVVSRACSLGSESLIGMCIARNRPMCRIFERIGMTLTREENDICGHLLVAARAHWQQPAADARPPHMASVDMLTASGA